MVTRYQMNERYFCFLAHHHRQSSSKTSIRKYEMSNIQVKNKCKPNYQLDPLLIDLITFAFLDGENNDDVMTS